MGGYATGEMWIPLAAIFLKDAVSLGYLLSSIIMK